MAQNVSWTLIHDSSNVNIYPMVYILSSPFPTTAYTVYGLGGGALKSA